jgi:ribonucleases P/MRP protein subunit RPP40
MTVNCAPKISAQIEVELPRLQPPNGHKDMYEDDFGDFSVEMYEWISLISLGSPRVDPKDRVDPFLSRYTPPSAELHSLKVTDVVKITWNGFTSSPWAYKIFVQTLLEAKPDMWFSFAVLGFKESIPRESGDCTVLKLPGVGNEYMLWEVEQS